MNFIFGADVVVAQSEYGTTMLFDNSVTLPNSKIFSAFISVLYAVALVIYMKKSRLGRAIRATAQNARAAKILGVDTEKVYAATFGINAALMWNCRSFNFNNSNTSPLCRASIYSKIFHDSYCCRSWKFTCSSSFRDGA